MIGAFLVMNEIRSVQCSAVAIFPPVPFDNDNLGIGRTPKPSLDLSIVPTTFSCLSVIEYRISDQLFQQTM